MSCKGRHSERGVNMQDSAATNAKKSAKRGRPHNRSTEAVRAYAATTGTFTLAAAAKRSA